MKRGVKNWIKSLTATCLLIGVMLISIVLNPTFLYAKKTKVDNFTIYRNSEISNIFLGQLENVTTLLKKSELYDATFKLDICLNDGSPYPTLLKKIHGQAFAWGFYNKIVLQGNLNQHANTVELNEYHWNFEQLIAHGAVHCYQFNEFGFWGSNPIAGYPNWKWEGYAEYVSRQGEDQKDLYENIGYLLSYKNKNSWSIHLSDGTISSIEYYEDWLLVKYVLDIKHFSYQELLDNITEKEEIEKEMMNWFNEENNRRTDNRG